MGLILQVFLSVFSGVLLSLAIPNEIYLLGCPYLTLICLVPLYIAFFRNDKPKSAFLLFALQTFTTHLISSFWLAYFKDYAYFTLGASAAGTAGIGGIMGLYLYLPYSTSTRKNKLNSFSASLPFTETSCFRILYFSTIYTLYEWVKSSGFLGYPWGTMSSAIFKWPVLMQLSSITGTYGITFILCMANALLAEIILAIPEKNYCYCRNFSYSIKQAASIFAVFMSTILIFGSYQYYREIIPQKFLTAILVQQNSDPWKEKTDEASIKVSQELTLKQLKNLEADNLSADLIVWSEGCLKMAFPESYDYYNFYPFDSALLPFVRNNKTPLLAGGPYIKDRDKKIFFNTAILFDAMGAFRGYYGKNHLVPFAEGLPFMEFPKIRSFIAKIVGISAGWTPGDQYVFFDIPGSWNPDREISTTKYVDISKTMEEQILEENHRPNIRISTPICFDDSFTDIMRPLFLNGTELFINITDDSWSLTKSSEYQHFVIASYRAIEYRTTLVRSCNSGYSVVLSPQGRILADEPLFEQASIACQVPVYKRTMTTYARFGNWLPYSLIFLLFAYSIFMFCSFQESDYIPSERKIKKHSKKNKK